MAKMWYPVIDYLSCQECGACTAKCKNGVYDQSKAPTPVVINPDNCIDHCRGCGKLCPNGAITYVGDNITQTESGCGCGGVAAVADQSTPNSKMKWLRIGILVLIAVVIAGIFIVKSMHNSANNQQTGEQNTESVEEDSKEADKTTVAYPLKITKTDIEEIKAYGVPTVIDFGSDSCIPCKEMAPVLETLNEEWQDKAAVQFMDVWKYTNGVEDFPVSVIPTQVFFNADGTPFVPSDELATQIEFTMYSDKTTEEHVFTVHQGGITEEQMRMIFAEMGVE